MTELTNDITIYNNSIIFNHYSRDGINGWIVGYENNPTDGNAVYNESITDSDLIIPKEYIGLPVIAVGARAFRLVRLNSISLPDSIIYIGSSGFDLCNLHIDNFILPSNLTTMGYWAFSSNQIKKVVIGSKVTEIGVGTFMDNPTLESIEVNKSNPSFADYNGCLYDKDITTLYCLPPQVKNFQFPLTVKIIKQRSVYLIGRKVLWLPPSVTIIEEESFFRITSLIKIHILGNVEIIGKNIFYDAPEKIEIYYHGQKNITEEGIFHSNYNQKVTAIAFVCKHYEGEQLSNLETFKCGNCDKIYMCQTFVNKKLLNKSCTFICLLLLQYK